MRRFLSCLAVAAALLVARSAYADTLFVTFHTDEGFYGSLTLTGTTGVVPGALYITSGTSHIFEPGFGFYNGVLSTPPPGSTPGDPYIDTLTGQYADNLAYLSGALFDSYGLVVTDGIAYQFHGSLLDGYAGRNLFTANLVIDSVTPTPEPSSIALLGTGGLAVVGALRRRKLSV